jgi:hypothetical protein
MAFIYRSRDFLPPERNFLTSDTISNYMKGGVGGKRNLKKLKKKQKKT